MHDRPGSVQVLTGREERTRSGKQDASISVALAGMLPARRGQQGNKQVFTHTLPKRMSKGVGFSDGAGQKSSPLEPGREMPVPFVCSGKRKKQLGAHPVSWERGKGAAVNSGAKTTSDCSNSFKR